MNSLCFRYFFRGAKVGIKTAYMKNEILIPYNVSFHRLNEVEKSTSMIRKSFSIGIVSCIQSF